MPDRPRAPEAFLPLRPVEFHVLLSLAASDRHGYGIIRDAEERAGVANVLDVGTLYRALRRMQDQGLIDDAPRRRAPESDERRTYYRITPLGLRVARAEARRLAALTRAAHLTGLLEAETP